MLTENLHIVTQKIISACHNSGRNISDIKLLAISKTKPIWMIEELFKNGITDFAESKAQDFRDKVEIIKMPINWHFVGNLQKNKIKYVVGKAKLIHSVDNFDIADEINKRAEILNTIQPILIEVNTSEEETKHGLITENDVLALLESCKKMKNIKVIGLMTMAPFTEDKERIRQSFARLKKNMNNFNKQGFSLFELSMGMSNDFEIAIEEGATIIRLGTILFGERNLQQDWRKNGNNSIRY